jgi:hypothetical protein
MFNGSTAAGVVVEIIGTGIDSGSLMLLTSIPEDGGDG